MQIIANLHNLYRIVHTRILSHRGDTEMVVFMICAYLFPIIALVSAVINEKTSHTDSSFFMFVLSTIASFGILVSGGALYDITGLIHALMPIAMIALPTLAVCEYRKTCRLRQFLEGELPGMIREFVEERTDAVAQLWQRSRLRQKAIGYQARKYRAEIQDATTEANVAERRMADNIVKAISAFRARKVQIAKDIRAIKRDLRRFRRRHDADKALVDTVKHSLERLREREAECDTMIQSALDWLDLVEEPLRLSRYQSVDMERFNAEYEKLMGLASSMSDVLISSPALESIFAQAMSDPAVLAEVEGGERALERVRAMIGEATPSTEGDKKKASGRRAQTV